MQTTPAKLLDVIALLESMAAGVFLGIQTPADAMQRMYLIKAARDMILQHESVIRAIAGRLMSTKSISAEELAAHLAPVLEETA